MMAGMALVIIMLLTKGHPKNWRVSQGWVEMWGGDWEAIQHQMALERIERERQWQVKNEEAEAEMRRLQEEEQQRLRALEEELGDDDQVMPEL